jgi:hypothetical protein
VSFVIFFKLGNKNIIESLSNIQDDHPYFVLFAILSSLGFGLLVSFYSGEFILSFLLVLFSIICLFYILSNGISIIKNEKILIENDHIILYRFGKQLQKIKITEILNGAWEYKSSLWFLGLSLKGFNISKILNHLYTINSTYVPAGVVISIKDKIGKKRNDNSLLLFRGSVIAISSLIRYSNLAATGNLTSHGPFYGIEYYPFIINSRERESKEVLYYIECYENSIKIFDRNREEYKVEFFNGTGFIMDDNIKVKIKKYS